MPYLKINDAEIWYEVEGEGPPLLLIAGIGSDVASWTPIVPLLSENHQLVMFDNRGAGRTRHEGRIDFNAIVGDAVALLDHLDIRRADVFGHSMGGMLALRLAARAPDRVDRIVAAACTAGPDAKSTALMNELCKLYENNDDPEIFFRHLFHWLFAPPLFDDPAVVDVAARAAVAYEFRQSPADFRRQLDALLTAQDVELEIISSEVLLLLPELDLLVPPEMTRRSISGLRNRSEMIIGEAGHSVHWDKPAQTAAAVVAFLKPYSSENR